MLERIPGARRLARSIGADGRRKFLFEILPGGSVCAEIGVHKGDFSSLILRRLDPKELHLIDPWAHETGGVYRDAWYGGRVRGGQAEMDARYRAVVRRFEAESRNNRVHIHRGYSSDVLKQFPDGYFDWVYIDGNHLREFVIQDLELSFAKTRAGGYLCGDDYMPGGWWEGGVQAAVDEFVRNYPVELVTTRNQQFVLRK